jgi:hypothetical protein
MVMGRIWCALFLALPIFCTQGYPEDAHLTLEQGPAGKPYIAYGGTPLLAYGPGDEMRLLNGAADIERWAVWQRDNGMNLLRAYPMSVPLEIYGAPGPHPFHKAGDTWDVDAFNDDYFTLVGEKAAVLERHGIVLHLQLWQIVFFKGGTHRWDANYLNPTNNSNDWTRAFKRGRDYIDAPEGNRARDHQREWVRRLLDSVKGRGNVWIDVINEIGNEMGTLEWAAVVVGWIREWEAENGRRFLVGVDSEHHDDRNRFATYSDTFDLLILNELKSYTHARTTIAHLNLPAVTVRSSDGRNQWRDYVFANKDQVGPEHQARYRMLCYRSLFAGIQSIGAYWKPEVHDADYTEMTDWPQYAQSLRTFWRLIEDQWPGLQPDDDVVASDTITPHAYALRSDKLVAVYLEAGSHTWNNAYPESELVLAVEQPVRVTVFAPRSGVEQPAAIDPVPNGIRLQLPEFVDDLAVLVWLE